MLRSSSELPAARCSLAAPRQTRRNVLTLYRFAGVLAPQGRNTTLKAFKVFRAERLHAA